LQSQNQIQVEIQFRQNKRQATSADILRHSWKRGVGELESQSPQANVDK
jgi:hypothetical protein